MMYNASGFEGFSEWITAGTAGPATFRSANSMTAIVLKRALAVIEEAAFLWTCRSAVAPSSAVTFDMLARFDERLSSLVFKLSEKPTLAQRLLHHDQPGFKSGLAFVTGIVALRGGMMQAFEELLSRLESDSELFLPMASALTWLEFGEIRPILVDRLLASRSPALLHLGIAAAVAHRVDPGVALGRALDSDIPALRARAFEAVGRLALGDSRPRLQAALDDEDAMCRFWSAWSVVRLGDRAGIPVLGRFAAECGQFAQPACDIALRALDSDQAVRAHKRLLSLAGERLAVVAAGIVGDPTLASWLIDAMESPPLARSAGAAFCLMTGRDLRRDDLDGERPPNAAAIERVAPDASESPTAGGNAGSGRKSNPEDDEADEDLVWPDVAKLRKWWEENRHAFVPGVRYLAGVPIQASSLGSILRSGNQQQRAAAALELALLYPNAPLLDVTAPAHCQSLGSDRAV